jgi:hypothetical protein
LLVVSIFKLECAFFDCVNTYVPRQQVAGYLQLARTLRSRPAAATWPSSVKEKEREGGAGSTHGDRPGQHTYVTRVNNFASGGRSTCVCVRSRVISIARLLPSAPLFNFPCLLGNLAYGRSFPPPDRSTCFFCLLERAAVPYLPDGLDLFLSFLPAEGEEASFPPSVCFGYSFRSVLVLFI